MKGMCAFGKAMAFMAMTYLTSNAGVEGLAWEATCRVGEVVKSVAVSAVAVLVSDVKCLRKYMALNSK